jgi:hypothetical protein
MSAALNPRIAVCILRSEPWGRGRLYSVQSTPDIRHDVKQSAVHTQDIDEVVRIVAAFLETSCEEPVLPRFARRMQESHALGDCDGPVTAPS